MPKGWIEVGLLDVAHLSSGKKDVNEGSIDGEYPFFTCAAEPLRSKTFSFDGESLLLPGNGANVGKVFYYNGKFEAYQRTYVLKDFRIASKYIFYHLKYAWNQSLVDAQFGSATNFIKLKNFQSYKLPLPPLPEQQRIVAKLDELMAKIDRSRARLERIPQILKRFRQSVLSAAVSGKLTEEWRERSQFDGINEVITSIKNERLRKAKTDAQKLEIERIYKQVEQSDRFEVPKEWRLVALNKVCESFTYGTSQKSNKKGLVPVLRMGNIQDGKLDWTNLKYSSDKEEIKKYSLNKNDVLFNRTNSPELVGKTAIYKGEQPALYAGYLIKINNLPELDSDFLTYCMNTVQARDWCLEVKTDGVSQSNINAQKLGEFEIPFCSLEEQQEIVRIVDQFFLFADRIEARYNKAKAQLDKLPQSLLAKAFRGELVPQNEKDEPASVLLSRIATASQSKPNKKSKTYKLKTDLNLAAEP